MQLPERSTVCRKADARSRQARQGASAGVGGCRGWLNYAASGADCTESAPYAGVKYRTDA
jgi:hypothetical protein